VALSGVVAFGLLIGLLAPALNRYVIRPVEELSKGVAEASAGNLDYPLHGSEEDELGSLAVSFTGMQTRLKNTYLEMEQKEKQLAALNEAGLAVTQLLELQEIMDFALDTVVDRLGMDSSLIYLWDEREMRYRLCASRGLTAEQVAEIDRRRRSGWDIAREVAETGREVVIVNMSTDSRLIGIWDRPQERSFADLPLVSRGMVMGVIGIATPPGRWLEPRDLEYIRSVGMQIGIALDNALLLDDTRRKEREAVALYNLGTKISASLALPQVLDAVAEAAKELLDADIGLVGLLDQASAQVEVQAVAGQEAEGFRGVHIPVWEGSPGHALVKDQPVIVEKHDHDDGRFFHTEDHAREGQIASILAAPLIHGERFLGSVVALRRQPRRFVEREARLLLRLAHQVVVSVENAQLYRQLRYLATLEERGRLAREMHDRLAQALGYLNVRASITDDLLSSGRIEPARESLSELKSVAKMVYTDLREAIFGLRTSVSSHSGLVPTLRHFLDEYQAHYGMEVQLTIRSEAEFDISLEAAGQLLCIVQEALANIRKHSGASRAFVRYDQAGGQVCLQIQDDGRGFDPARVMEVGGQHIGLQIMRERAESVGGSLEIESEPGKGTQVTVRAPILN
jgi:nitrate/nitrite-specific signal transduction histidine kinase